ncbi:MAG TPA: hypothetical protein VGK32_13375 [Vicinamibacterales bacterium]|jgi:hypothetical protein
MKRHLSALALALAVLLAGRLGLAAQVRPPVPQAYPRPPQQPATPAQKPTTPAEPLQAPASPAPQADGTVPSEATLGLPLYPTLEFLTSYDAGRGQRFYLFGTTASFADVVAYYKSVLKQRGELVFEEPATHMFEVGRFREDAMGFPPSITVKDYTWGGLEGYPNPKPNAEPARFATVVQVVPVPAAASTARR